MFIRARQSTSNQQMVEELQHNGTLTSESCIQAFLAVDRQHFWVPGSGELAYADMPLRHGKLHQSAPHIYARALESLMPLTPGMSFLNVGSGTGYFSSIVSELIREEGINEGMDIWPDTVSHAQECCRTLGKEGIRFTVGNVYQLDVDQGMRYDRIYLGACANSRSKYLYRLLEVGGILVGPFQAGSMQQLRRVVRRTETHFAVEVLNSVQFATLVEPPPVIPPGGDLADIEESGRSVGLRGVPFTFALRERPWTMERNPLYPASFRDAVVLMVAGTPRDLEAPSLPPEIWLTVLPWCSRLWFEVEPAPLAPPSSPVSVALMRVGQVAKKAFWRALSAGSDGDSDQASTAGSTSVGTRGRSTSMDSTASFASDGSLPMNSPIIRRTSSSDTTLYEALGSRQVHAIGTQGDPDDIDPRDYNQDGHHVLLVTLVEERVMHSTWHPRRVLRCFGWCGAVERALRSAFQFRCFGWCGAVVDQLTRIIRT